MSAVLGIYYFDGRPVGAADLNNMVVCLRHRGPDSEGTWSSGSVGLGSDMLWTTPESLQERYPVVSPDGTLILVADARIDNREDLISAMALSDSARVPIGDGELIWRAYERWGEDAPARLIGDFAFAIWDRRRNRLFCARDHIGAKPLYYYLTAKAFVFASEIKAILCLPDVPRRLNEARLADHIVQIFEDRISTFYQNILRLPPAHALTITPTGARLRTYWSLDPQRELRFASDDDYVDAFQETFDQAVHARLRSAYPVGSTLSGGLDSSSIACTARDRLAEDGQSRLHTFSAIFPSLSEADLRKIDERSYIEKVLAGGGCEPHFVRADELHPLADLDEIFWHQDQLVLAPNLNLHRGLYRAARQADVRILLDGIDGDTTVSHGLEYLADLARTGHWRTLAAEIQALAHKPGVSRRPGKLLWLFGVQPLLPRWPFRAHQLLLGHWDPEWASGKAMNPSFARRIDYGNRAAALLAQTSARARNSRDLHYYSMTSGLIPLALEVLDKAAAEFGLEVRYPFFDRRLMEFCLALPGEQKFGQGWTRWTQRRAMADRVPAQIRWRFSKADLSPNFTHGLLEAGRELSDSVILDEAEWIAAYYDLPVLRAAYQRFQSAPQAAGQDGLTVYGATMIGLWLQCTSLGQAVPGRGGKEALLKKQTEYA